MCISGRSYVISKLENLVIPKNINTGNVSNCGYRLLDNILTYKDCQVIEIVGNGGKSIPIAKHVHEYSQEVIYQVRGKMEFEDGSILSAGEIRIIPPGKTHSPKVLDGGAAIVVIHPVDSGLRDLHIKAEEKCGK